MGFVKPVLDDRAELGVARTPAATLRRHMPATALRRDACTQGRNKVVALIGQALGRL